MKKIKDFILGFKKGWELSILPNKISKFHNSPWIRIFRVVGGLSILICLGKGIIIDSKWIIYVVPITILYFIYTLIILSIKIKHIIYIWKSGKLDFRNSPLNKLMGLGARLAVCVKGACEYGLVFGSFLGAGFGIDQILTNSNRPPVFGPIIGTGLDNILNKIGIKNPNIDSNLMEIKEQISKDKVNKEMAINLLRELQELKEMQDNELISMVREELGEELAKKISIMGEDSQKLINHIKEKYNDK